jgi:glycogen debranching enzyme
VKPRSVVAECRDRAVALLRRNLGRAGILAATPGARAGARGYDAVFARDASICALGMALSGDAVLARGAARAIVTLAAHQAGNGQIPKFVDPRRRAADFWYVGCIDATLWWLIAVAFLDAVDAPAGLRRRLARPVRRALAWLACQEHPRFKLLQQNEASDWADIMPRSGFVLASNALWHLVKRHYGLPHAGATRRNANQLFHPFSAARVARYRRAELLMRHPLRGARDRDLYLSFVNLGAYGDEGDVYGNLLSLLCGLADERAARRTLDALARAQVASPYPARAVCRPITPSHLLWRPYMTRHRLNLAWQYHNGGIWPFIGGFWVAALAACGRRAGAEAMLRQLARANALGGWAFSEWLHGRTGAPRGMPGQSWNAAAFLLAYHAVFDGGRALAWTGPTAS